MKNETQDFVAPRHQINSDTVWLIIIGLVVIGGATWYFIHQHQTQAREDHAVEMRQQQKDASIAALALKYNAVTNWEASLPDRGGAQPFSIDVSSALIRSNSQPVLLELNLEDVAEKNGGYTAQFSQFYLTGQNFQLSVELKCTVEQVKQILAAHENTNFQSAVVARITEVSRPKFKLTGSTSGSGEDADISVELDDSQDVFLARGELLDIVQLP